MKTVINYYDFTGKYRKMQTCSTRVQTWTRVRTRVQFWRTWTRTWTCFLRTRTCTRTCMPRTWTRTRTWTFENQVLYQVHTKTDDGNGLFSKLHHHHQFILPNL